MDQAAWGYSAPALFNGQPGDDLKTISLTLEDLRGSYCSEQIATNDPGQAVDLAYAHPLFPGFVQPRGAGLPLSPAYTDSEQSPGASLLLSLINHADVSGHVLPPSASLPLSPAYTASDQSPGACLPLSPAYTASDQSPGTSLLLSPACTASDQSPGASLLLSPAYTASDQSPGASLLLSPAYTASDQSPGAGLLLSPINHADVSGSACIGYSTHANELLLPQPQSDHGDIFPDDFQAIPPQNSAYRGCQYPTSDQNFEQSIFWLQHPSNTVHQFGHDNSNHMPSGFEQILGTDLAPVTSNSQPCVRCRVLKKKVFLFS